MKKTIQTGMGRMRTRALAAGLLGLAVVLGCAVGQAATVADLLKFLPPNAQAAVGLPDIAAVEQAAAPLLQLPQLSQISSLAVHLGGDTLAEGLANSGINVQAPAAGFVKVTRTTDIDGCGVLMVQDAAKVKETLFALLGTEGTEITLPGDVKGRFIAEPGVGYFFQDDKLFLSSDEELLQQMAGRITEPAAVNYGKNGPKDEVVAFSRIDIIEQSNLLNTIPGMGMFKPLLDTIKPFSDEVILAVGEAAGKAYLRVAAHDISNAPITPPAPLGLHGFMDPGAPAVMNLRITPELINALSLTLMNNPATRQAGGYIRIASGLLGDELALSFAGMKSEEVPEAVIAAKVKNAESVPNLLKMLAKIEAPSYTLENKDVYVYPNVSEGTDLHIAAAGETIVVTPGKEALETAVGRFGGTAGATGINEAVVNRGVYGFVVLDGAKATNLPEGVIPQNIDLSKVNLALTLGIDNDWRELVFTAPGGFSDVAEVVDELM